MSATTPNLPETTGLTFEKVWLMFQESDRKFQETREEIRKENQESEQKFQEIREEIRQVSQEIRQMSQEIRQMNQESDRKFQEMREEIRQMNQETDQKFQETDRRIRETNKKISDLGSRIGDIIEAMVKARIDEKFNVFGYEFTNTGQHERFVNKKLNIAGEIDLLLQNKKYSLLIEVKTHLETSDVKDHIARLEKYRLHADYCKDKRKLLAAVAGAVIRDEARDFALASGIYVIGQSGETFEITKPNFQVKVW